MNKDSQSAPGGAEVTHSPGPWTTEDTVCEPSRDHRVVYVHHGTEVVAQVWRPLFATDAATRANARLIAAAPDLLDATRAAYRVLAYPTAMGTDLLEATRLELRAAIQKATEEVK